MQKLLAVVLVALSLIVGCAKDAPEGSEPIADQVPAVNDGWQRLQPRNDLSNEQPATPEEVVVGRDGTSLLVRFWGGAEPCFGARAAVAEDDTTVEVQLITGLPPEAIAATCIAIAVAYEIEVPLAAPLGDRELVIASFAPAPGGPEPGDGAMFLTDQYLGLTLAEAKELAAVEGRVLRIARIDEEAFALTEDFDPSRVNVEIEDGIVVAVAGW